MTRGAPSSPPPKPSRPGRWTRACCAAGCRPRRNACRSCRPAPGWAVRCRTSGRANYGREPAPIRRPKTLTAMPPLRLDAAFVPLNLGDSQGNAAYTGIDPYFDDLFLMAAERRYLSVERLVSTQELVKAVPPQALLVNRMMVDAVAEAPNGAQLHTAAPEYGRDEKFQRHYAEAASTDEGWQKFVQTYLSGGEAEYQAAVRTFAESAS